MTHPSERQRSQNGVRSPTGHQDVTANRALEVELQPKLKLARVEGASRLPKDRKGSNQAGNLGVDPVVDPARQLKVRAVQDVETLRPELQVDSLAHFKALNQRDVGVEE